MSDVISENKNTVLYIRDAIQHEYIAKIGKALAVPERLAIMKSLLTQSMNLLEISKKLSLPLSSVSRHIDALVDAQLVFVTYQPGPKGHTKLCSKMIMSTTISFEETLKPKRADAYSVEMPIGLFTDCDIKAPCGMNGSKNKIGGFDDPSVFYSPERINAECLWFEHGFISYRFPLQKTSKDFSAISFSFEVCSEAVFYNSNWPSDITILINDTEVCTFTSSGDFGGRRGRYTPEYWPITSTQFGLLKTILVSTSGTFVDNKQVNSLISFEHLAISKSQSIKFSIGIKKDAVHRGGINLFGKNFGDFNQAIIMTLR